MGCIYRIYCAITGRCYIGQSAYSHPFVRFLEHQSSADVGENGPLYDDLRMYGVHEFECICICVVPNDQLNDLECYYAEQYGAYIWEGGYNQVECGGAPVRREVSDHQRMWMKRRAIAKYRWK